MTPIRQLKPLLAFAAGSLATSLLVFGTSPPAVSDAATATGAANNEPDLTVLPLALRSRANRSTTGALEAG